MLSSESSSHSTSPFQGVALRVCVLPCSFHSPRLYLCCKRWASGFSLPPPPRNLWRSELLWGCKILYVITSALFPLHFHRETIPKEPKGHCLLKHCLSWLGDKVSSPKLASYSNHSRASPSFPIWYSRQKKALNCVWTHSLVIYL